MHRIFFGNSAEAAKTNTCDAKRIVNLTNYKNRKWMQYICFLPSNLDNWSLWRRYYTISIVASQLVFS